MGQAGGIAGDPVKRALVSLIVSIVVPIAAAILVLGGSVARAQPPTLREADPHVHVAPIVVPRSEPEPVDKRPYLVVGGALVFAAIMIWNRSRARALEAEHGATPPRRRRWRVQPDHDAAPAARDHDDDADDLAAAADDDHDKESR